MAESLKIRVVDLREARSQGHDVHSSHAALHLMCRLVQLAIPPGIEGSAAKRAMLKCLLELGFEAAPESTPGPDIYVQRAVHMGKLGLPMKQLAAANRVVGDSYAAYDCKMAPVLAEMPRWVEAEVVPGTRYLLLRVDRLLKLLPKLKPCAAPPTPPRPLSPEGSSSAAGSGLAAGAASALWTLPGGATAGAGQAAAPQAASPGGVGEAAFAQAELAAHGGVTVTMTEAMFPGKRFKNMYTVCLAVGSIWSSVPGLSGDSSKAKLLRFVLNGLLRQGLSQVGGNLYLLRPVELVSGQEAVQGAMRAYRDAPFLLGTFAALYGSSLRAVLDDPACRPWVTFLWEGGKEFVLQQLPALLAFQTQQLGISRPAAASAAPPAQQVQALQAQAAAAAARAALPAAAPMPLPFMPEPSLPGSSWEDDEQLQGGASNTGGLGSTWDPAHASTAVLHGSEAVPGSGHEHSGSERWDPAFNGMAARDPVPQGPPSPPPASVAAEPEEPALWQEGAWAQVTFEGEQLLPRYTALQPAAPDQEFCTSSEQGLAAEGDTLLLPLLSLLPQRVQQATLQHLGPRDRGPSTSSSDNSNGSSRSSSTAAGSAHATGSTAAAPAAAGALISEKGLSTAGSPALSRASSTSASESSPSVGEVAGEGTAEGGGPEAEHRPPAVASPRGVDRLTAAGSPAADDSPTAEQSPTAAGALAASAGSPTAADNPTAVQLPSAPSSPRGPHRATSPGPSPEAAPGLVQPAGTAAACVDSGAAVGYCAQRRRLTSIAADAGRPVVLRFADGSQAELEEELAMEEALSLLAAATSQSKDSVHARLAAGAAVGIPGTLHRVQALLGWGGEIEGLSYSAGCHVPGLESLVMDILASVSNASGTDPCKAMLVLGPAAESSASLLRACAATLAGTFRHKVVVIDDELGSLGGACCGSTEAFLGAARRLVPSTEAPCHRLLWDAAAKHCADVVVVSSGVLGPCTAAAEMDVLTSVRRLISRGVPVVLGLECSSLGSLQRSHLPLREAIVSSSPAEAAALPVSAVLEAAGEREVAVYCAHGTAGGGLRLGGSRAPPVPERRTFAGDGSVIATKLTPAPPLPKACVMAAGASPESEAAAVAADYGGATAHFWLDDLLAMSAAELEG